MKRFLKLLLVLTMPSVILLGSSFKTSIHPSLSNNNQTFNSSKANQIYDLNTNFLSGNQILSMNHLPETMSTGIGGQYFIGTDHGLFMTNKFFAAGHLVDLANNLAISKEEKVLKVMVDQNNYVFAFTEIINGDNVSYHLYYEDFSVSTNNWIDMFADSNILAANTAVVGVDIINNDANNFGIAMEVHTPNLGGGFKFLVIQENPAWADNHDLAKYIIKYQSVNLNNEGEPFNRPETFSNADITKVITDIKVLQVLAPGKYTIIDYAKSTKNDPIIASATNCIFYNIMDATTSPMAAGVIFNTLIMPTIAGSLNDNIVVRIINGKTWLEMMFNVKDRNTSYNMCMIYCLDNLNNATNYRSLQENIYAEYTKTSNTLFIKNSFSTISQYNSIDYIFFNNEDNEFCMQEIDLTKISSTDSDYSPAITYNVMIKSDQSLNFYNNGTSSIASPFSLFSTNEINIMYLGGNIAGMATYDNAFSSVNDI